MYIYSIPCTDFLSWEIQHTIYWFSDSGNSGTGPEQYPLILETLKWNYFFATRMVILSSPLSLSSPAMPLSV